MRGRFGKHSVSYCSQHAIHIAHDFIIPEPQNPIIVLEQPSIAYLVVCVFGVLATINFYDQSFLAADKIYYVMAYRLLPNKLMTVDRPRKQSIP